MRGACRAPYKRAWNLEEDGGTAADKGEQLREDCDAAPQPKRRNGSCQCRTVLALHIDIFKAMKHTGVGLKKREI